MSPTKNQGAFDEAPGETAERGGSIVARGRFLVSWSIDYGYRLVLDNDQETIITPEFSDEKILQYFNNFFSADNLAANVGKRVYCECSGERYERYGAVYYKIQEARLSAE